MSRVDNYLKLIVRAPQTDDDRKHGRLGRMVTHEIFTFGPDDREVALVLKSLAGVAEQERAAGNEAVLCSFGPLPFPTSAIVDRIGRLDFARSKMNLPPSQLYDRHKKAN
jgi:hypothetical protein